MSNDAARATERFVGDVEVAVGNRQLLVCDIEAPRGLACRLSRHCSNVASGARFATSGLGGTGRHWRHVDACVVMRGKDEPTEAIDRLACGEDSMCL